ncbi:hypothetical protein BV372_34715 [Nostoc sp. T09]|nr:hypothetical protein BV372_34715 [Nostoc sp. T09]
MKSAYPNCIGMVLANQQDSDPSRSQQTAVTLRVLYENPYGERQFDGTETDTADWTHHRMVRLIEQSPLAWAEFL